MKKYILTGGIALVCGAAIGAGAMYGIQHKKIEFAKDYSILPEVIEKLDDVGLEVPDGSDTEEAVVNGYLSLFDDKYTFYRSNQSKDESEEGSEEKKKIENITCEMKNGNILYVRIHSFQLDTEMDYGGKVDDEIKKAKGVIIDLRDNGGGEVGAAINIADRFLKEGYMTEFLKNGEEKKKRVSDNGKEIDLPVVMLVNENTASASEVFTALMMQNYDNVTVVGEKTFGKGIFQKEIVLSNGGTLRYTYGYYTVGDWECYQGIGIEPDETIEMDKSLIGTFSDTQLKRALQILG